METFKVKYKGQLADAIVTDSGMYAVQLPTRKGDRGTTYTERIVRRDNKWEFSSREDEHPDYFFTVGLYDDGTMEWQNDMSGGPKKTIEKFDPKFYDRNDTVECVCAEIYDIAKQFEEYEKLGISAEKVVNLRKVYLASMIKMLGYQSTDMVKKEPDPNRSYLALGKVASMLERYKNLATMFSQMKPGLYSVNVPEGMSQEELKNIVFAVAADIKSVNERMAAEDDLTQTKRGVLPTFGLTMREDLSEEEWSLYSTNVSRTAELLLELNYDIVPDMDKITLKDESKLDGLDLGDRISRLIDTKEFSEACNIEDNYVKAENDRLASEIDRLIDDSDRVINSSVGAALDFLKRQAMISRDERDDYIKKYEEIEKMYYSKLGKTKPEEPVHEEKNEEEEGTDPYED